MKRTVFQYDKITMLCILALIIAQAYGIDITKDRLKISKEGYYIPYISSYSLDVKNEKIKAAIISIHGSKHNVNKAFNDIKRLIDKYNLADSVLILAPQFLMTEHIKDGNSSGLVYWDVSPFWGTSISKVTPDNKNFRISAFTIVENIINDLASKKNFPNIESITIIGHSAGGQFVNRFSISNTIEDSQMVSAGIKIKYIVMNPSSYLYLNSKRPLKGSVNKFTRPSDVEGYDNYGYGLQNLYSYHRQKKLTAEEIRQQFQKRNVIYMLGNEDTKPELMSVTPAAMLQGENRLKRGLSYYNHLIDEFGPKIKENQKLVIIPKAGHSGRDMILSSKGAVNLIGELAKEIKIAEN